MTKDEVEELTLKWVAAAEAFSACEEAIRLLRKAGVADIANVVEMRVLPGLKAERRETDIARLRAELALDREGNG